MQSIRQVMEYTGMNMREALEMPCDLFMLCRKNMIVEELMQTEKGREYLEDCKAATQTKPDFEALHRLQRKLR